MAQDTKAEALEDVSSEAPEESLEDLELRLEEARKTADERLRSAPKGQGRGRETP